MKHLYLIISSLVIILLFGCFNPPVEENGYWLDNLIENAESGTDTSYTQAIWSYDYNGQIVYYTLSLPGWDYNNVYDSSGTHLGSPDGGWQNSGDGTLEDFFEISTNETLIWTYDSPIVEGADEEYQIFNTALRSRFPENNYLHVLRTTFGYTEFFAYRNKLDDSGINYDTLMISDFLINNITPTILDETYLINSVHTVSRIELNEIWTNYDYPYDWQEYYRRYPESNGIIDFSRPGFSADGDMAVMTFGWQFSGDGGQGYLIVLEKIDGKWMVRWRFNTWVS